MKTAPRKLTRDAVALLAAMLAGRLEREARALPVRSEPDAGEPRAVSEPA